MPEAERPVGADRAIELLDDLLTIGVAVEGRVFHRDPHIGDFAVADIGWRPRPC
jgi:hypothetical protein